MRGMIGRGEGERQSVWGGLVGLDWGIGSIGEIGGRGVGGVTEGGARFVGGGGAGLSGNRWEAIGQTRSRFVHPRHIFHSTASQMRVWAAQKQTGPSKSSSSPSSSQESAIPRRHIPAKARSSARPEWIDWHEQSLFL